MQDMKQFRKNINLWIKAFPFVVEKVYDRFGPILISDIRTRSLAGQVLNRQTGNLQKSIHTVMKKGKAGVHMFIGTDVTSPKGFGYGAYWFGRGRDFLNPAIDKNLGKIGQAIGEGIERKFKEVVK